MPNPALYCAVLVGAATVTALLLVIGWWLRIERWRGIERGWVIGCLAVGLACGFLLLKGLPRLPPTQALDRLLVIAYPALLVWTAVVARVRYRRANNHQSADNDQSADGERRVSRGQWQFAAALPALRNLVTVGLLFGTLRVLLHDSTYLQQPAPSQQAFVRLVMLGGAVSWWLLLQLWDSLLPMIREEQIPSWTVPAALCLALLTGAATIMLTGYVTGGAATMPFVGVILGAQAGAHISGRLGPHIRARMRGHSSAERRAQPEVISASVAVGLLGLVTLMLLGRFFGGLSNLQALTIVGAPILLIVVRWLPGAPKQRACLSLFCVAVPLAIVVVEAKQSFDRKYEKQRILISSRSQP